MAFEQRDMSGSMFQNDKEGNEKWPDWKGKIMVMGAEFWISGWSKNCSKGEFISLAIQPKEMQARTSESGSGTTAPAAKPKPQLDFGEASQDDIPF